MKREQIIDIGKQLSKEYVIVYLETNKGVYDITDNSINIVSFREDDKSHNYIMLFETLYDLDIKCEIIYELSTGRIHSSIFKRISVY